MATEKDRPDQGGDERQQVQRRQVTRMITVGMLALAAIVGAIAFLGVIVTAGTEEHAAPLATDDTTEGGGPESADPATGWSAGYGLPPKGTALSTPISGQPIARFGEYRHKAFVYADGRVLWFATGSPIMEGRLTPKGVELLRLELRSGKYARGFGYDDLHSKLPAEAWTSREIEPYASARFAICFSDGDPSRDVGLLPTSAQALLRTAKERDHRSVGDTGCLELTTAKTRVLDAILKRAGARVPDRGAYSGEYSISDTAGGDGIGIWFDPLLPNGEGTPLMGA